MVYISNTNVTIFGQSSKFYILNSDFNEDDMKNTWMFIDFIAEYKPL